MQLTWYGTAGFRIETAGQAVLIDPYLTRSAAARPHLAIGPADVRSADAIFVSHGHFDHALDVPQIASQPRATVYCSATTARTLARHGLDRRQIRVVTPGARFDLGAITAQCFAASHVRFDLRLIAVTLKRALPQIPALIRPVLTWPAGPVLAWRFTMTEEDDRIVQHMGSAGCTREELARLQDERQPDVLMVPLQGHTRICQIAARIVARLAPRLVIPHHHDDSIPPITHRVDIEPFVDAVEHLTPPVELKQLPMGTPVTV